MRYLRRRKRRRSHRNAENGDGMLSSREVAHLLGLHINTVRRWTDRGIMKAYRVGPRGDRRFQREDIDDFLIEQSEQAERERLLQQIVLIG